MSSYLIELSIIHIAMVLGYWFLLRQERKYATMRFYLLGSTCFALTIPLLKLPNISMDYNATIEAVPMEAFHLHALQMKAMHFKQITTTSMSNFSLWNSDMLVWIYLLVSLFFLSRFLINVFSLVLLVFTSSEDLFDDVRVRRARKVHGSFTFFNWIFLGDEIKRNRPDSGIILKHEMAHATLRHTYDLIFLELFKVFFWWLPTAWFVHNEIKKIHELQADAYALKSCSVDHYSSVLIHATLKSHGLRLTSSFHHGFILKRVKAMRQQTKNVRIWKLASLAGLCAMLFIAFACGEEITPLIEPMEKQGVTVSFNQLPSSIQADLEKVKDQLVFRKIAWPDQFETTSDLQHLTRFDQNMIYTTHEDKANGVIYLALKKGGTGVDYLSEQTETESEVFTIVEELPEFKGGMKAFYEYLRHEMRYPLEARKSGVEGRVDVQFIVEKNGSLTGVKAIEGIGAGCDGEAIRVVQKAPPFNAGTQGGKPVRVRMVLPIIFKLDKTRANPDHSAQGMIIMEEAKIKKSLMKVDANYNDGAWSGIVYDEEGETLPGASVVVIGSTTGTVSDLEGTFKLSASKDTDLNISFVGYENVRIKAD